MLFIIDKDASTRKEITGTNFEEHGADIVFAKISYSTEITPETVFPDISEIHPQMYFSTLHEYTDDGTEIPVQNDYNYVSEVLVLTSEKRYSYTITLTNKTQQ